MLLTLQFKNRTSKIISEIKLDLEENSLFYPVSENLLISFKLCKESQEHSFSIFPAKKGLPAFGRHTWTLRLVTSGIENPQKLVGKILYLLRDTKAVAKAVVEKKKEEEEEKKDTETKKEEEAKEENEAKEEKEEKEKEEKKEEKPKVDYQGIVSYFGFNFRIIEFFCISTYSR